MKIVTLPEFYIEDSIFDVIMNTLHSMMIKFNIKINYMCCLTEWYMSLCTPLDSGMSTLVQTEMNM